VVEVRRHRGLIEVVHVTRIPLVIKCGPQISHILYPIKMENSTLFKS
jgi:hypothetical protein